MSVRKIFFVSLVSVTVGIHLEMISLLPRSIPVGPALPWTEPALLLAAEMVNRTYAPHITMSVKLIYNMTHKTCEDADADNPGLLGEYYYSQDDTDARHSHSGTCWAVIGSMCGGFLEAANLAREWNIVAFSNGLLRDDAFSNEHQPTAVSLGGNIDSYAMVLMKILDQNGWRHVSLLTDANTGNGAGFYGLLSNALMRMAMASSTMHAFESTNFDGKDMQSVLPLLARAKSRSRVIFLLTLTGRALNVLDIARNENMTSSEYVYFIVQPLEQEQYGRVSLFSNSPQNMNSTYARVTYVTTHKTDDLVANLNYQLATRTDADPKTGKPLYDNESQGLSLYRFSTKQPLENFSVRATYDSIELFAKIVNETVQVSRSINFCNGSLLVKMMSNRNFDLQTGETFIKMDSTRNLDLDIYGYDQIDGIMRPLMWYDSVDGMLKNYSSFRKDNEGRFTSPLIFPPPDEPECGYSGLSGPCAEEKR
ncbi:atrial natriuretic peptide receptor 1-like [Paramacrobiotus metropolitanus]|uniref:atrial natriuretic peptide receptor 1-like n=1 Tax=Paramacrobiotus metropolitanus TaxID=2943436 RepID=UPI002445BEF6|nr:atrial natriuretic peptide receptor 1-like [Paramacrobiotus metropolitanus]